MSKAAILIVLILVLSVYVAQRAPFSRSGSVSAILTGQTVGVYWDSTCSKPVSSVSWGTMTPGGSKSFTVYVRNEGAETIAVSVMPLNWTPTGASYYMRFTWTSTNTTVAPGKVVKIVSKLEVSPEIKGISTFSFTILFSGNSGFPEWDVNQDGKVDIVDISIVTLAYGSDQNSSNWDSRADVDHNKVVDVLDLTSIISHFGDRYP